MCGGVLDDAQNKRTKYCSDSCKMKAHRVSKESNNVTNNVTEVENNVTSPEKKTALPTANVKTMNAEQLYSGIESYKGGEWIDSPEYKELHRRLQAWSVEKLRKEGYWIPNSKQ